MSASDPSPPAPAPSRSRRWLVPLLVASLALNLVVVGAAVSGMMWAKHGERGGFHRSADLLPRSFFRELDDERREELAAAFRARKPEFREDRRGLREAATALAEALEREPFDPELARSAIAEHAGRSHRLIDFVAAFAGGLVESLTPEERSALAQAIRRHIQAERDRRDRRSR